MQWPAPHSPIKSEEERSPTVETSDGNLEFSFSNGTSDSHYPFQPPTPMYIIAPPPLPKTTDMPKPTLIHAEEYTPPKLEHSSHGPSCFRVATEKVRQFAGILSRSSRRLCANVLRIGNLAAPLHINCMGASSADVGHEEIQDGTEPDAAPSGNKKRPFEASPTTPSNARKSQIGKQYDIMRDKSVEDGGGSRPLQRRRAGWMEGGDLVADDKQSFPYSPVTPPSMHQHQVHSYGKYTRGAKDSKHGLGDATTENGPTLDVGTRTHDVKKMAAGYAVKEKSAERVEGLANDNEKQGGNAMTGIKVRAHVSARTHAANDAPARISLREVFSFEARRKNVIGASLVAARPQPDHHRTRRLRANRCLFQINHFKS